jgi:hypothetical protein
LAADAAWGAGSHSFNRDGLALLTTAGLDSRRGSDLVLDAKYRAPRAECRVPGAEYRALRARG